MKVKNWMKTNPVVIERTALLQEAAELMRDHAIRHLPVVDDGKLVGFITQTDLKQYFFPSMVEDIPVHEVMATNPITVDANSSIEQAAKLIHDYKIGGLPVLDKNTLVGVVTASDLVSGFIEVLGLLRSSIRLDIIIDKDGGVDEVTKIIKDCGLEIMSVARESNDSPGKIHYFRLGQGNIDPLIKNLEQAGYKVVSVME
ncbi:MAG: CBS and ACT domain-containing protein [Proteobacteria bacterium]|nr:CBS and ACT domain-containing protein [Pseudomonadota bacterium]MBU1686512.1 CBS and ACT domain-containing protein [Pseudomonadota bacterium]